MLLGSHVGIGGREMLFGSVKEAVSYRADTFMVYTGAPQNTIRRDISEMKIPEAHEFMHANGIERFVVHAPYIINLANTINPEIFKLGIDFLAKEIERSIAMGAETIILHPGAHVGAGADAGIKSIADGLNKVLYKDMPLTVSLETMAGKGTEIGRNFEELARILDLVNIPDKIRICFDTCHTFDAGYDIKNDFSGVMTKFDKIIGKEKISVFHINDSKNELGSRKDRHANIGKGSIGFDALFDIVHTKDFENVPKILETPYIDKVPPYREEIVMLRGGTA